MEFPDWGQVKRNIPYDWSAYVKSRFASTKMGLCLQLKRPGTKYAAQKIKFLTSTVTNGRPFHLSFT